MGQPRFGGEGHGAEKRFEIGLLVVEERGSHVGRGHDVVEPRAAQRTEHGKPFVPGGSAIVDGGDPMAMQIDESPHGSTLI